MVRTDFHRSVKRQVAHCNTLSNPWMVNVKGLDPCRQVEQLCSLEPHVALGAVSSNLSCPSGNNSQGCCCVVETYALLSACWVCQGHNPVDIEIDIRPSYIDFFRNSGCSVSNFSDFQLQPKGSHIPPWAMIFPNSLSNHWNFSEAQVIGLAMAQQPNGTQPTATLVNPSVIFPTSSFSTLPTTSSLPISSKSSSSPKTITAAVLGSLALTFLIFTGVWFVWRRRRRPMNRLNRGTKVDLTEPEMEGPSQVTDVNPATVDPPRQAATFPFPFEGIVPRYHSDAPHSWKPSCTDVHTLPDFERESRTSGWQIAPVLPAPFTIDQLDRDLALLQGVDLSSAPKVDESGHGQVQHSYIYKRQKKRAASINTSTPSSNSSSTNSRRARRKSGGDAARGRYFHFPPSAQYLANVARYPGKVDLERPWDIRREERASWNE